MQSQDIVTNTAHELFAAISSGEEKSVTLCLGKLNQLTPDVAKKILEYKDEQDNGMLHTCVKNQNLPILKHLLPYFKKYNANLDLPKATGDSALNDIFKWFFREDKVVTQMVDELVKNGAKPDPAVIDWLKERNKLDFFPESIAIVTRQLQRSSRAEAQPQGRASQLTAIQSPHSSAKGAEGSSSTAAPSKKGGR